MRHKLAAGLLLSAIVSLPAQAAITLFARGVLSGTSDRSGLSGTLENGLPANILGGMGSGLTYAGGNTFLAVPDRGPNATPYNSAVDDTVSYISRFHTLSLELTANGSPGLPFTLTPTLQGTTLLSSSTPLAYGSGAGLGTQKNGQPMGSGAPAQNSAGKYYFSGRSDNFAPGSSGNPANGRLDPESIRVSNDGKSVFISDEYGPYVRQFDRQTGTLVKTFTLPANLDVSTLSSMGKTETSSNTSGRTDNKGMEGLAITPDGKTLVGIMQASLIQDAAVKATKKMVRIVTIDIATGATKEYGYMLTVGSGVSEITAINDHEFLVDERDGAGLGDAPGSNAVAKQFFKIDLAGAVDITNMSGAAAAAAAVGKAPFLDLVAALNANGISSDQIPAKIEGITFGQDVTYGGDLYHTLFVSNDNDFVPDAAGPNQFFVFGFKDGDLPGLVQQRIAAVPESATWAMMIMGFGLVGGVLRTRRSATVSFS